MALHNLPSFVALNFLTFLNSPKPCFRYPFYSRSFSSASMSRLLIIFNFFKLSKPCSAIHLFKIVFLPLLCPVSLQDLLIIFNFLNSPKPCSAIHLFKIVFFFRFYVPCPFRTLAIMALHNLPSFVALNFLTFLNSPKPCSAIHLFKIVFFRFYVPSLQDVSDHGPPQFAVLCSS
ncbi:unnamed protein product [Acanthosepion pharaonis]|uniref:Uncharacterized protein n=1 Tax=Acanthosepion pharaonis TaxID=158019 RepID=A0A812ENY1_ACAPH|nr:unnamed protein product [Sepia pharaonis]